MAAALLRSGARRVAGSVLMPQHQARPLKEPTLLPFVQTRALKTSEDKVRICAKKFDLMKKSVEGKDIEMMKMSSDMRRQALESSWSDVKVVATRSTEDAFMPRMGDSKFVCSVLAAILLVCNYEINKADEFKKKAKEYFGQLTHPVTKFFEGEGEGEHKA